MPAKVTPRADLSGPQARRRPLSKTPTGIRGLDEVTLGGIPTGRPTLVCGSAGCGKTLLAMEFLVRGATEFGEPGVFMAFEETERELAENVASLGFDLDGLVERKKVVLDHVRVERSEIEETGEYDLEGLFVRLGHAIDSVKAKRVVLDTLEVLFASLPNPAILRAELRRLFRWLKDRGVTAVITAERGDGSLTRHGLEEYVSDCVIVLDHRVNEQISTRRLRILKYRGSSHGTNEFPFLIDEKGFSVLPITSLGLNHAVSDERITTGVARLDEMLAGGVFRGSSVLVSGTAGTGKTSLAAHLAAATCERGERVLYFAFEESSRQIRRNMRSIGLDLGRWVKKGLLEIHSARPNLHGLEMHLVTMHQRIEEYEPHVVVVDPITNLAGAGTLGDARAMLTRLIDYLKGRNVTTFMTSLTGGGESIDQSEVGISSLIDTWILVRDVELGGERNRALHILKSRGTAHSNQVREFVFSGDGVRLLDVYLGPGGVLTGSARMTQEAKDRAEELARRQEADRQQRTAEGKRKAIEAQIEALKAEAQSLESELRDSGSREDARRGRVAKDEEDMAKSRNVRRNERASAGKSAGAGGANGT